MCYQVVEVYAACRCLYYQHAVDRCASYGRPGHEISKRTIPVGYACSVHTQSSSYGAINWTESEEVARDPWDRAGTGFPISATKCRFDVDIVVKHSYSVAGKLDYIRFPTPTTASVRRKLSFRPVTKEPIAPNT
ncbi:hypothetical protein F4782DRAFT_531602 [Xylaria castorea]|nr:hypothetical protein F4782DRAFT_531602 [Xylaria castorea]